VALRTWPHLQQYYTAHDDDDDDDDDDGGDGGNDGDDWLVNKLSALIPATLSSGGGGGDGSMGCDAVLLTRLLLEEQLLDEGRSNGCGGKYGSQFHPSSSSSSSGGGGGSSNGSRPLTVGEITANWNDGACLRDTVRIRYSIDRMDPIPIIRERIRTDLLRRNSDSGADDGGSGVGGGGGVPELRPYIVDALLDCTSPVTILVGDESHVPMAVSSLARYGIPVKTITRIDDDDDNDDDDDDDDEEGGSRFGVHPGITIASSLYLRQITLRSAADGGSSCYVHIVHSDVTALQRYKTLFGDNRPMMRYGMFGKIGILSQKSTTTMEEDGGTGDTTEQQGYLKLSLSKWANSGPQQQNDAMMDPWLNLIDESELLEALSARIVTAN